MKDKGRGTITRTKMMRMRRKRRILYTCIFVSSFYLNGAFFFSALFWPNSQQPWQSRHQKSRCTKGHSPNWWVTAVKLAWGQGGTLEECKGMTNRIFFFWLMFYLLCIIKFRNVESVSSSLKGGTEMSASRKEILTKISFLDTCAKSLDLAVPSSWFWGEIKTFFPVMLQILASLGSFSLAKAPSSCFGCCFRRHQRREYRTIQVCTLKIQKFYSSCSVNLLAALSFISWFYGFSTQK